MPNRAAPVTILLLAVLSLAVLLVVPSGGTALLKTPLAFFVLAWFPGYVLIRLAGRTDPIWSLAAPFALAPLVSTAVLVIAALLGAPFGTAVILPVALAGALLALDLLLRGAGRVREREKAAGDEAEEQERDDGRGRTAILIVGLAGALVVGLVYVFNPWLSWRADGRFHIGVVAEILRGGLPPRDPFFAPLDLQYMWFFHAFVAGLRSLSGAPAPGLLSLVNVTALFAFTLLVWRAARGLGRTPRESLLAALLTAFAMGGLSWVFLPVKMLSAFTGTVRGLDAIREILDVRPLSITSSFKYFTLWMDQPFLLRKFLVGTAVSLSLTAMFLHLETSRRALFGGGLVNLLIVAITAAGAIVLHPMMGLPAVAVVCAAGIAWLAWQRWRPYPDGRASVASVVKLIAANMAGGVLSLPYLLLVTAGKEGAGGLPIDFAPAKIVSLGIGTIGVGLLAIPWLLRTARDPHPRRADAWAALWVTGTVLFALFVKFPLERENIDKPTLLTHIPLAFVAGWTLAGLMESSRPGRRKLAMALLILMLVPLNVMGLSGYLLDPDPRTYRVHEKEAFAFIDETAPADAVVFDSQDRDRPGVEIQRRQYWGHEQFAFTHEYPKVEMDARRAVRDAIYSPAGPDAETLAVLRKLGASVYVIVRAGAAVPGAGWPAGTGPTEGSFAGGDADPLATHAAFDRVYDRDDVRVYRMK